ncbi:MAG: hypothetical protein ABEN55_21545, partial [Bradymonadaceae bacterium]
MSRPTHSPMPIQAGPRYLVAVAVTICAATIWSGEAAAAGLDIGENTTLSLAKGGTGVASKRDPSALYFNPALLPRTRGTQLLADVNLMDRNIQFHRDDLVYRKNRRQYRKSFEPIENQSGPAPIPALAVSSDFGTDNFAAGLGIFAPHAYGQRCFGKLQDGECEPDRDGPGRYLIIGHIQFETLS